MEKPTCATCPFWDRHISEVFGSCRRHTPKAIYSQKSDEQTTFWPETHIEDWCGEHPLMNLHVLIHLDESKKPDRCKEVWLNAQCMLANDHKGHHEYLHHDLDRERCPVFIGGERCGKQAGHDGKHIWANGD